METELSKKRLENIKNAYADINTLFTNQTIIEDNKSLFYVGKQMYRVSMPTQKQQTQAENEKEKLYGKLLQTEGCHLKNRLKKILEEKQGVDIEKLEKERNDALIKYRDAEIDLALIGSDDKEQCDKQTEIVIKRRIEFEDASLPITEYLSHCIENRCEKKYKEYLTYLCTEKLIDDKDEKWELVWDNFEEFEKEKNADLLRQSVIQLNYLMLSTKVSQDEY